MREYRKIKLVAKTSKMKTRLLLLTLIKKMRNFLVRKALNLKTTLLGAHTLAPTPVLQNSRKNKRASYHKIIMMSLSW